MATEILTGGMNLAFARWGDRWKRMRRAANIGLSSRASAAYAALQEQEARHFLRGLLTCDGKVDPHIRRHVNVCIDGAIGRLCIPASAASEHQVSNNSDTVVKDVEDYVSRMLKAALPGNYLVEFFPWMMAIPEWFPGAGWKRQGYEWFKKDTAMFVNLVAETQTALEKGTRSKCFVSELANTIEYDDLTSVETAWLAGMML
ncbi:hypothetical protein EIP86_000668 [Pleurotus ostreatoroseus]|nr:hypothetical protein EIP86_000668 [Pleurotus ostreatoroseus]